MDILGFELSAAVAMLENEGVQVAEVHEVRSRKGLEGNERRVVRVGVLPQSGAGIARVALTYAWFQTVVE